MTPEELKRIVALIEGARNALLNDVLTYGLSADQSIGLETAFVKIAEAISILRPALESVSV